MAHYTSKYKSLGFYVGDKLIKFANGEYETEDKAEIEALESVADAIKTAEAPKPKATPAKKAPAKKEA